MVLTGAPRNVPASAVLSVGDCCAGAAAAGGAANGASSCWLCSWYRSAAGGDACRAGNLRLQLLHIYAVGATPFGVEITVSGSQFGTCASPGVLGHIVLVGRLLHRFDCLPGSFVARADMFPGRTIEIVARILKIIPVERPKSLRRLPGLSRHHQRVGCAPVRRWWLPGHHCC